MAAPNCFLLLSSTQIQSGECSGSYLQLSYQDMCSGSSQSPLINMNQVISLQKRREYEQGKFCFSSYSLKPDFF